MRFKLNNDLDNIRFTKHNKFHFWVAMFISFLIGYYTNPKVGFAVSYGLWFTWEVYNGFAPWHTDYEESPFIFDWMNWVRKNLYYSDGFSYQDVFVWDLMGALIGTGLIALIS